MPAPSQFAVVADGRIVTSVPSSYDWTLADARRWYATASAAAWCHREHPTARVVGLGSCWAAGAYYPHAIGATVVVRSDVAYPAVGPWSVATRPYVESPAVRAEREADEAAYGTGMDVRPDGDRLLVGRRGYAVGWLARDGDRWTCRPWHAPSEFAFYSVATAIDCLSRW